MEVCVEDTARINGGGCSPRHPWNVAPWLLSSVNGVKCITLHAQDSGFARFLDGPMEGKEKHSKLNRSIALQKLMHMRNSAQQEQHLVDALFEASEDAEPEQVFKRLRLPKALTTQGKFVCVSLPALELGDEIVHTLDMMMLAYTSPSEYLTIALSAANLNYIYKMHAIMGYKTVDADEARQLPKKCLLQREEALLRSSLA